MSYKKLTKKEKIVNLLSKGNSVTGFPFASLYSKQLCNVIIGMLAVVKR